MSCVTDKFVVFCWLSRRIFKDSDVAFAVCDWRRLWRMPAVYGYQSTPMSAAVRLRQSARQLPHLSLRHRQAALPAERHRPVLPARPLPRRRLSPLRGSRASRDRGRARVGRRRGSVPARHPVRLQRARLHGERAPAHRSVRPARQLFQREGLPGAVVLAGAARGADRRRAGALGVGVAAGTRSTALRAPESQDHGATARQRRAGKRTRPQDVAPLHRVLLAAGRRLRPQAGRQELDRSGGRRHPSCAVGQLPRQAVRQQHPLHGGQQCRSPVVDKHRVYRRRWRLGHGTGRHTITMTATRDRKRAD